MTPEEKAIMQRIREIRNNPSVADSQKVSELAALFPENFFDFKLKPGVLLPQQIGFSDILRQPEISSKLFERQSDDASKKDIIINPPKYQNDLLEQMGFSSGQKNSNLEEINLQNYMHHPSGGYALNNPSSR